MTTELTIQYEDESIELLAFRHRPNIGECIRTRKGLFTVIRIEHQEVSFSAMRLVVFLLRLENGEQK